MLEHLREFAATERQKEILEAELVKPFWDAQTAADYLKWLRK